MCKYLQTFTKHKKILFNRYHLFNSQGIVIQISGTLISYLFSVLEKMLQSDF